MKSLTPDCKKYLTIIPSQIKVFLKWLILQVGNQRSCQQILVVGLGQIFWPCSGPVSHLWFGSVFGKFPLKIQNFHFFILWVKKNLLGLGQKVPGSKVDWPLIYCWPKVCSGRVMAHLAVTGQNKSANWTVGTGFRLPSNPPNPGPAVLRPIVMKKLEHIYRVNNLKAWTIFFIRLDMMKRLRARKM